ncbi:MAG: GTP-binding protein, partial [Coprococcus sp.]
MARKEKEIPVYIFMGFLDSGKTTFVNETLLDRQFTDGERTLLLVCEDGEEEYDSSALAAENIYMEYIDEEQLTTEHLLDLQDKYKPEKVMIEYNGMWKLDKIFEIRVPKGWTVVQVLSFVNAETYDVYSNNMKATMIEQVNSAD